MLIRCEKCSTLYELDDRLLPPQGAPVQCSKCQFVFKAYPAPPQPSAPERAANDGPDEGRPERGDAVAERAPPPRDELVREGGALAHSFDRAVAASRPTPVPDSLAEPPPEGAADARVPGGKQAERGAGPGDDAPKFTADGRPIRKVPFPVSEPPPPGPRPSPMRGTAPKPGKTGRSTGNVKWVIVAVVIVALLAAAAAAWVALRPAERPRSLAPPAGQSRAVPQGGTPESPARN